MLTNYSQLSHFALALFLRVRLKFADLRLRVISVQPEKVCKLSLTFMAHSALESGPDRNAYMWEVGRVAPA